MKYARIGETHHGRIVRALRAQPLSGNVRDLFRVAFRFLAARADDDAPLTVTDAVDYALLALDGGASDLAAARSRRLARAFAEQLAVDPAILDDGPLEPERLIADFKRWFAREVTALARRTGRPESGLTTMNERTLRNWRRKEDAEGPE